MASPEKYPPSTSRPVAYAWEGRGREKGWEEERKREGKKKVNKQKAQSDLNGVCKVA